MVMLRTGYKLVASPVPNKFKENQPHYTAGRELKAMKTYYNRTITVDNQQVTRNVTEKHGVATVNHDNQKKEVAPSGNPLDTKTVWTVKSTAQA